MRASKVPAELAEAKQRGYYSIGSAAQITGVTAKMIRHYESLGLIPKANRTAGDYRVYSSADLHALRFIRRARDLGFSIDEISGLLNLWRNQRRASAEVKRLALKHLADLDRKIEQLQSMRATIAGLAGHCHGDERPDCPILDDLGGLPTVSALRNDRS
ncbi:MAG: Cu(I)-responsive transcriptional regulator [Steroidobacteraceae bacterium]